MAPDSHDETVATFRPRVGHSLLVATVENQLVVKRMGIVVPEEAIVDSHELVANAEIHVV